MANSHVGYIALLRQLAFRAKVGRRSLDLSLISLFNLFLKIKVYWIKVSVFHCFFLNCPLQFSLQNIPYFLLETDFF